MGVRFSHTRPRITVINRHPGQKGVIADARFFVTVLSQAEKWFREPTKSMVSSLGTRASLDPKKSA